MKKRKPLCRLERTCQVLSNFQMPRTTETKSELERKMRGEGIERHRQVVQD
jgi:hypothetical protein